LLFFSLRQQLDAIIAASMSIKSSGKLKKILEVRAASTVLLLCFHCFFIVVVLCFIVFLLCFSFVVVVFLCFSTF